MIRRMVAVAFRNLIDNEDVVNSITTKDRGIVLSQMLFLFRSTKACSLPHCVWIWLNLPSLHAVVKFSSPRKALSPIHNTNGIQKAILELSLTDQLFPPTTLEPRTPKTPFPENDEFKSFGTPLDKFGAQVSTLKVLTKPILNLILFLLLQFGFQLFWFFLSSFPIRVALHRNTLISWIRLAGWFINTPQYLASCSSPCTFLFPEKFI